MKRLMNISVALVLIGGLAMTSCKSKKETQAPVGETEVIVPCSGPDYFSNDDYFRANAMGESLDQAVSKKKAMSNARADLASAISTTIKALLTTT